MPTTIAQRPIRPTAQTRCSIAQHAVGDEQQRRRTPARERRLPRGRPTARGSGTSRSGTATTIGGGAARARRRAAGSPAAAARTAWVTSAGSRVIGPSRPSTTCAWTWSSAPANAATNSGWSTSGSPPSRARRVRRERRPGAAAATARDDPVRSSRLVHGRLGEHLAGRCGAAARSSAVACSGPEHERQRSRGRGRGSGPSAGEMRLRTLASSARGRPKFSRRRFADS